MSDIQATIEEAFERRADITPRSVETHVKEATLEAIDMLDRGVARVAEKQDGQWVVNDWLKKAVLLSLRVHQLLRQGALEIRRHEFP
jgi:2,3,4,5-tetrahydropyridine-2-carboxylate N-succinyltransferase